MTCSRFAIDWYEFYREPLTFLYDKAKTEGKTACERLGENLIQLFGTEELKGQLLIDMKVPEGYCPYWDFDQAETIFIACHLMDILWPYSEEHNITIREMVTTAALT
jgi:hypothetical protein